MEKEDQRNFILAVVLMIAFVWVYQTFIIDPDQKIRRAAEEAARAEVIASEQQVTTEAGDDGGEGDVIIAETVDEALTQFDRVPFEGPGVDGSIRLSGARIDDLSLKDYMTEVDGDEEVRIFRPETGPYGYYAAYGWLPERGAPLVGVNTDWQLVRGEKLTPQSPITLAVERDGIRFERQISLDENYMFTYADTLTNTGSDTRELTPFGVVRRYGEYKEFLAAADPNASQNATIVHQGLIGVLDGELKLRKYNKLAKGEGIKGGGFSPTGGWVGLTDKYWMGALIPQQDRAFEAEFTRGARGTDTVMEIKAEGAIVSLAPGATITLTNRVFGGAKRLSVLKAYEEELGIERFDDAVDWGWLYFLTKPFFSVLSWLAEKLGSFGLAIMGFVVLLKILLFPLYNSSYKSMAKMKKLQEPMKELRERFAADKQRQQQEIMKLYKREKANPVAGCLPILLTIPVFFALYKTLYVTLEMRHEPFLWMRDLSAPDPTAIGNLFGLLPWSAEMLKAVPVAGIVIGIGALPILYGVTMWILQSLNPPPPDPTQRKVIMMLPIVFTFVFGGFAGGLVLYWVWNNVLSTAQQYTIMRRQGVETEVGKFIAKHLGRRTDSE